MDGIRLMRFSFCPWPKHGPCLLSVASLTAVKSIKYKSPDRLICKAEYQSVPLVLDARGAAEEFTIRWDGADRLPEGWQVILADNETGDRIQLREAGSIRFYHRGERRKQQTMSALPLVAETGVSNRFTLIVDPQPADLGVGPDTPEVLELAQNYPNPFNPATVISYALPEQAQVRLTVYDMLGRTVGVLVDEQQAPGRYHVAWDASSHSSGVYVYRIDAGGLTLTRKMTLVR